MDILPFTLSYRLLRTGMMQLSYQSNSGYRDKSWQKTVDNIHHNHLYKDLIHTIQCTVMTEVKIKLSQES